MFVESPSLSFALSTWQRFSRPLSCNHLPYPSNVDHHRLDLLQSRPSTLVQWPCPSLIEFRKMVAIRIFVFRFVLNCCIGGGLEFTKKRRWGIDGVTECGSGWSTTFHSISTLFQCKMEGNESQIDRDWNHNDFQQMQYVLFNTVHHPLLFCVFAVIHIGHCLLVSIRGVFTVSFQWIRESEERNQWIRESEGRIQEIKDVEAVLCWSEHFVLGFS